MYIDVILSDYINFGQTAGFASAAARIQLISSRHDKGISWVETLFITQVTLAKPVFETCPDNCR